jgi:hypothetical protein
VVIGGEFHFPRNNGNKGECHESYQGKLAQPVDYIEGRGLRHCRRNARHSGLRRPQLEQLPLEAHHHPDRAARRRQRDHGLGQLSHHRRQRLEPLELHPEPPDLGQTTRSTCGPKAGRIEVCNYAYGSTGWLGIAQIWLAADGHISQGTSKMNDTYYAMAQYNTPAWRAAVMCQEIGHDYGLGHQDEDFNTDATNSCMEYTNVPAGNEHPDTHDYNQLASIYSHVHSASNLPTSSAATPPALAIGNTIKDWGRVIGTDKQGHHNKFERDLGNGVKVITHVTWLPDMHVGHNH